MRPDTLSTLRACLDEIDRYATRATYANDQDNTDRPRQERVERALLLLNEGIEALHAALA